MIRKVKKANKLIIILLNSIIIFLASTQLSYALGLNHTTEAIEKFEADIFVEHNGLIKVTEHITYNFGSKKHHGIFRFIPLGNNQSNLAIKILSITDDQQLPYDYTLRKFSNEARIKIGNSNEWLRGIKTFVISYEVTNAIAALENTHLLYWNITGNEWDIPIKHARANISLPSDEKSPLATGCYTGEHGSKQHDCLVLWQPSEIKYKTTQTLQKNEGLTIALEIPKYMLLSQPQEIITNSLSDSDHIIQNKPKSKVELVTFFILLTGFMLVYRLFILPFFFRRGANRVIRINNKYIRSRVPLMPKELKAKSIAMQHTPPQGLSIISMAALLDQRIDPSDLGAAIIDMAIRGYMKIRCISKRRFFFCKKTSFELIRLTPTTKITDPAERIIFNFLFDYDRTEKVKTSELNINTRGINSKITSMQTELSLLLLKKGYFKKKKVKKNIILETILNPFVFIMFLLSSILIPLPGTIKFIGITLFVLIFVYAKLNYQNTLYQFSTKGIDMMAKILGFKKFLSLNKSARFTILRAQDNNSDMFEKYLPYAILLGVDKPWIKQFGTACSTPPKWYASSRNSSVFNHHIFISELMQFNHICNKTFSHPTSLFSSGSTGSGFSGGGFGGGGGGSW